MKKKQRIERMRYAGSITANIVDALYQSVGIGTNLLEIDSYAKELSYQYDVKPAFLGFRNFSGAVCTNVNSVVIHGVPHDYKLKDGDILSIDFGVRYMGIYTDTSVALLIGEPDTDEKIAKHKFLEKSKEALYLSIEQAKVGNRIGDISNVMFTEMKRNDYDVLRNFVGHGIGEKLHDTPDIPCFGEKGVGPVIYDGMTMAIEIMATSEGYKYSIDDDGWSVRLNSGYGALFEHTVLVTADGHEILTKGIAW